MNANAARLRRSRALKRAQRQLKRARRSRKVQIETSRIVLAYLEDQIQTPLSGLSHSTLAQLLQQRHVSPALIDRVIAALFGGEVSEYSQAEPQTNSDVVKSTGQLVGRSGKGVDGMKRLGFVILLVAMLAVAIGLTAQLTAPRPMTEADRATFARANQLAEAGQVAAAVNLYEQLSAQGIVNADLFYNLGQAYAQLGKTNQAVEYYTRAAQIAPRDGQIAERLKQAGFSTRSVVPLTTNELMLGALLLASVVAVLFVWRRRWAGDKANGVTFISRAGRTSP